MTQEFLPVQEVLCSRAPLGLRDPLLDGSLMRDPLRLRYDDDDVEEVIAYDFK